MVCEWFIISEACPGEPVMEVYIMTLMTPCLIHFFEFLTTCWWLYGSLTLPVTGRVSPWWLLDIFLKWFAKRSVAIYAFQVSCYDIIHNDIDDFLMIHFFEAIDNLLMTLCWHSFWIWMTCLTLILTEQLFGCNFAISQRIWLKYGSLATLMYHFN